MLSITRLANALLLGLLPLVGIQAAPLMTAPAVMHDVPDERLFDGVIEAVNQSTVSSQIVGRIAEINYDVDDFVPKGAVILRFHSKEQTARVEQAEAGLKEARALYQEASDEYQRVKDIYAKQLIAKAQVDKADAALKAAKARLDAAEARVSEITVQSEHAVVRAPFAGYVTKRHVEVGETVNVGQPLMTGLSLESLRVVAQIPQAFVKPIRDHGKARVVLENGRSIESEKIRVFPYADEQSHAFKVRVNLVNGDHGLYPGMFVKVAFVTGEESSLLVPASSVVHRSELTAVYVVDTTGKVSLRQIRAGREVGKEVEVLAGLEAGEKVALDPIAAGIQLKQQDAK
ncbi:MAG: efflux RND transporter periplasmic adaptor subunit [Gammaproteobacteria bacterium]|nr:efflux RND transporter periplasmic adaptor subunit [Gammaproteobacteria bacterium]